jgi:arabinofuranosyltransferase
MTRRFRSQAIPVAVALLALGVVIVRQWQVAGDLGSVPLDDAYIHYRFADNLAHGRGFAFNPGEPTPGSTSPLWVVLLAAGELAGLSPILASKLLGALSFVACAWLTWRFALRLTGDDRQAMFIATVAGALVALSGRMIWAALSGMETLAFAALTLAALDRLLDHPLDAPTSALLGLAALLRPEGYLLFFFVVLISLFSPRPSGYNLLLALRRLSSNVLIFAIIVLPYVLFSFAATGSPLPNTFRANARELTSVEYLFRYVRFVADDNSVVLVLALLGLWAASRNRRLWPLAAWALGFPLLAALLTPNLRHHGRYSIPLIPFYVLLAVVGLRSYADRISEGLARRAVLVLAAAMMVLGVASAWRWSGAFAADARDITQMHAAMGRWVEANTPNSATLALSDIGAITYLSGRRVIDLVGLVTTDILPAVSGKPVGLERDQSVFDYLVRHRPDFVVIIPTWYPYLASSPGSHLSEVHTVQLDHTPSVGGGDHLRAYRADWSWLDERAPEHSLSVDFGVVALDGFDVEPGAQVKAGSPLTVTLRWRSLEPAGRFKVFVHLLDSSGKIAAQHDGEPVGNLWPTNLWRPGDVIRDEHVIALPVDLVSGQYTLKAGMYDPKTLARLPIGLDKDSVTLGQVQVIGGQ